MKHQSWQNWIAVCLGIWLALSPWLLNLVFREGLAPPLAVWATAGCGVVVALVSFAAMFGERLWQDWTDIFLAVMLILSPWILPLDAYPAAGWNAVVCGLALLLVAGWEASKENRHA